MSEQEMAALRSSARQMAQSLAQRDPKYAVSSTEHEGIALAWLVLPLFDDVARLGDENAAMRRFMVDLLAFSVIGHGSEEIVDRAHALLRGEK